jgi:hypothetical protein
MNKVYVSGNTVFIHCIFYNKNTGEPINPQLVKLKIYNKAYNAVEDFLSVAHNSSHDIGYYEVEFDTPPNLEETLYYYSWEAEIDGKNAVNRGKFTTKFMI